MRAGADLGLRQANLRVLLIGQGSKQQVGALKIDGIEIRIEILTRAVIEGTCQENIKGVFWAELC